MREPRLLMLSPASLAPSASRMRRGDSRGALQRLTGSPAAPCSPPDPHPLNQPSPRLLAAELGSWFALSCFEQPPTTLSLQVPQGPKQNTLEITHCSGSFAAQKEPLGLSSLVVTFPFTGTSSACCSHTFSPVTSLLPQPLPCPCPQPSPRARRAARGCPRSPPETFCSSWAKHPLLLLWKPHLRTTDADLSDPASPALPGLPPEQGDSGSAERAALAVPRVLRGFRLTRRRAGAGEGGLNTPVQPSPDLQGCCGANHNASMAGFVLLKLLLTHV